MKLESISQAPLEDSDRMLTTIVVEEVESSCILARQMIDVLGRPGVDNDMQMLGANDTWTIVWTTPQLTLAQATHLVNQTIA